MVVGVTGNVEPGAGIDQRWIPALQNVVDIVESASQSMQSISFGVCGERRREKEEEGERER